MSRPEVLAGAHTLTRQVENTLFRFHAYHLQRSTTYFDDLLAMTPPPPLEDDDAGDCSISLDDVKASDFQALLWFYYESGCSWYVVLCRRG